MYQLKKRILAALQEQINKKNRKRLSRFPERRSIIANNCIGGYIYHYLKLPFASPTINLFILPSDYIQMLQDFDQYFDPNAPIVPVETDKTYPVGNLYGCRLFFKHYTDFDTAVNKWRERCKRINKDALYICMTDRDGCTYEDLKAFDLLDYKNKVVFTNKPYADITTSFYIRGFEKEKSVGQLAEKMNITGKRYIDQFDYVAFLNRSNAASDCQ